MAGKGPSPAEVGNELGTTLLQRGQLSPDPLQLAVDARQLGPCLPFPEMPVAVPGLDQALDLPAKEPQPRIPVDRALAVLERTRADGLDDLILGQPELRPSGLIAQRRALAPPVFTLIAHD